MKNILDTNDYPNLFIVFLWRCSGVIPELLVVFPIEWSKYTFIGLSILLNSLLATLTAAYALHYVIGSIWLAVIFGVIWGLFILNLDAFTVSTLARIKMKEPSFGISKNMFFLLSQRIVLTFILSFIISPFIQVAIFQKDIQVYALRQITLMNALKTRIAEQESKLSGLTSQQISVTNKIDALNKDLEKEISGTGGSRKQGRGLSSRSKEKELKIAHVEKAEIEAILISINHDLMVLKNQQETLSSVEQNFEPTFISNLKILVELSKQNNSFKQLQIGIILAIILISNAPILTQAISPKTIYDYHVWSKLNPFKDNNILDVNEAITDLQNISEYVLDNSFLNPKK